MNLLKIGSRTINLDNVAYVEYLKRSYPDYSKRKPDDFYGDHIPRTEEIEIAVIHFTDCEYIEVWGEEGLKIVRDNFKMSDESDS